MPDSRLILVYHKAWRKWFWFWRWVCCGAIYETFIIYTAHINWQSGACVHHSSNNCLFHDALIYNSSSLSICAKNKSILFLL